MATKKRVFTVGPGMQYTGHSVDKVNYLPGQTFNLDHLIGEQDDLVKSLLDRGAVMEVTGLTQKQIDAVVKKYKKFTQAELEAELRKAAAG